MCDVISLTRCSLKMEKCLRGDSYFSLLIVLVLTQVSRNIVVYDFTWNFTFIEASRPRPHFKASRPRLCPF